MPSARNLSEIFIQTLEQAADSVVVIDSSNNVLLFNRAAEQLWGLDRTSVIGHNVKLLVPQDIRAHHDDYIEANRRTGINKIVGSSRTLHIERADGTQRWASMSISKIEADDEVLYTAFVKDITAQHLQNEQLRLLSLVVDRTDNAILITDAPGEVIYTNSGFSHLFGYSAEHAINKRPANLLAPYMPPDEVMGMHTQLAAGQPYSSETLIYCADGQRIWCHVTINPIFDAQGVLSNTVAMFTDITHTKMHEVLNNRMLEAIVREDPLESLMEKACREVERIAPEITTSILGVSTNGLLHPLAAPSLPASFSEALEGLAIGPGVGSCGTAAYLGESVLVTDIANDPLWADFKALALPIGLRSCWSTPIKDSTGRVLGTFAFYYREPRGPSAFHRRLLDVIVHLCSLALQREESRSKIRQLAFYDSLTNLPNRSLLHARADQALAEAERNKSQLSVLFVDLDRFKQVNDSLGHPAGDELLRVVAQRLSVNRRSSDIVGRLSGDEFVLVLPHCDSAHVSEVVEQLRQTLSEPCQLAGSTLCPSASIGISLFPGDGHDMGTLIHRADMAMYQAKSLGRGRFSFFSHELNQLAQERLALETALREALETQQLRLHYQPQVRMQDGLLYGVEALARWHHPLFGDISPARFIPLAEECGLINQLGLWAVREACRQLAAWRRQGLKIPAISVNLSPTNFHNLDLPGMIASTLQQHNLEAGDLTLEITENVVMDTNPATMKTLHEVHAQGVRLSLDDFGTGYSSLSYLRRLPIQELKLDQSFVNDLEEDATNRALSEAVILLGESLHLTVVAEGIESIGQQRILKDQGYHVAQGYLFSRPLNAADLEAWLSTAVKN
ncbi:EAL domain-containing protein [Pseudomonas guineae]|uniref:EAL domain-containing protein n=1 Tax=Pseudomonas guineae TaxID=425504 RepID=UPI003CFC19A9